MRAVRSDLSRGRVATVDNHAVPRRSPGDARPLDPSPTRFLKVLPFPGPKQLASTSVADEAVALVPAPADVPATALGSDEPRHYDRITVRAITVALVLSLFAHIAVLVVPFADKIDQELKAPADEIGPLSVTVAPSKPRPPSPVPEPKPQQSVQQPTPRPPTPVPRTRPTPPRPQSQIAINSGRTPPFVVPAPTTPQPPTPEVQTQPQPVVPTTEDFSQALAARQQARRNQNGGAPDEVVESDDQRANRIAKANIAAQQRSASPGQDQSQAGGIFEMKHTGLHEAEFVFNGWNRDFRRKLGKTYEVKQGNNPDIRIAVVRQMIEIIREQQPGDFEWYSYRLKGRSVIMSARPKDQKELEAFLLKEFYEGDPRAQ